MEPDLGHALQQQWFLGLWYGHQTAPKGLELAGSCASIVYECRTGMGMQQSGYDRTLAPRLPV